MFKGRLIHTRTRQGGEKKHFKGYEDTTMTIIRSRLHR